VTRSRVLVLCTHNSARSQMAEGFLRALAGDRFQVASAGTEAAGGEEPERLAAFRRVRDQIAERLRDWLTGRPGAAA
jgi:arsenate reductase